MMGMVPLFDDRNYHELLPQDGSNVIEFGGVPRVLGAIAPKLAAGEIVCAPAAEFDLIPRSEWPDRIRQKDRDKSWLEDLVRDVVPCNDQGSLNYCHAFGTVMAAQVARLVQGHPFVELSGESVGGPVTNWRNAGADPTDDVQQLVEFGACPVEFIDKPFSLKHSKWTAGWEHAALNYRCQEWKDLRAFERKIFDAAATVAFRSRPSCSGFGWWSHFISGPYRVIDLGNGKYALRYRNNWGATYGDNGFVDFSEGKGTPDWSFVIESMVPQD